MTDRRRRRAAWAASAGLHAAAAGLLWAFLPRTPPRPPEPDLALVLTVPAEPEPVEARVAFPAPRPAPAPNPSPPEPPPEPTPAAAPTGRPPVAVAVPSALPRDVAAFVRAHADRPAVEAVQDVVDVRPVAPVTPAAAVGGTGEVVQAVGEGRPRSGGGPPLHGALPAGRTVAYVLDCSGTMGLGGRFDRARAAVLATLDATPAGVRVVVIAYSGRAAPVVPGGPAEPTAESLERIAAALAKLEPAGASRHAEGVRAALRFDPDYVVLLTDADESELAEVRPVLRGARRPVSAAAARVTADGVGAPKPVGGP